MKEEIRKLLEKINASGDVLRDAVGDYSDAMSAMYYNFGKGVKARQIRRWGEEHNDFLNVVGQYWRLLAVMWMADNKPGTELLLAETEVFVSELSGMRPRELTETDARIILRQLGVKLAY